jgi:hypothetical protein
MRLKIALPFIKLKQEKKTFYCENHLIKFLLDTPKVYSLIYSRDLGFTPYPLKGFRILSPSFDGQYLINRIKDSLTILFSQEKEIQPFKSMSVKDTLRYILTFIIGLGYSNRPPRIKVSRKNIELSNAYYYVKNVLNLDYRKPISVVGNVWLNLEAIINEKGSLEFLIQQGKGEPSPYRVLELLVSSNNELRDYVLKLGSE